MPSDSGVEESAGSAASDLVKKQGKKVATKAVWAAIAPALPFIAVGLLILFIVGVIALAIYSYVNVGAAGQTAFKKPDPVNEQLVLANTDDANAKSQAIALAGDDLIISLEALKKKLEASGDQASLQKVKDLQTALLSLIGDSPTNVVSISDIQRQFEELKQNLGVGNAYAVELQNIADALDQLNKAILTTASPKLIISGKDKFYIRTHQVDDRVLRALNYLVTPQPKGAGFRKIKVRRIKSDYDSEGKQFSKEWEFSSDEDWSISPHFSGQGVDIAGIDMVERSLYKKGIIRKKREMKAPVDIMVSYQSNIPGKTIPGSSVTSTGFSFGNLSSNQALVDLFSIIGENSGYDFSKYNLEGATLPEIAKMMGMVVLNEELNLKIDSLDDNSSQEKFLTNIGKNYIANYFSLPKEGLKGDSPDKVQTNIGHEVVTQRMKLAPLSLTGDTSRQIFENVGKRKMEKTLGIRLGSLNYLAGDFTTFVGQVLIEEKLNLEGGTFAGDNLTQIKNKINIKGDGRFENTFTKNPDQIDTILNLPQDRNYTSDLISGVISVYTYKRAVGQSLINSVSVNFKVKPAENGQNYNSKKDDAWDMPYGSMDNIIAGQYSDFYNIGVDEVVKRLVDNDGEREVLNQWFAKPALKTQPLENLRFVYSEILGRILIRSKDEAIINNDAKIKEAREAANAAILPKVLEGNTAASLLKDIDETQKEIKAVIESYWDDSNLVGIAYDWARADKIAYARGVIATSNGQLEALEELKWQVRLGEENGWSQIYPEQINSALGIPADGITKIFQQNKGNEVFFAVGGAKIEASDELYNPAAASNSAAKINFLNRQADETTIIIADLERRKAEGEANLDEQINMYKKSLGSWNDQIILEQTSQKEREIALSQAKTQTKDADIKLSFNKFSDVVFDLDSALKFLGSQKIQSALNLPEGSLTSIFDYTATESVELKYMIKQRESAYKALQDLENRKNNGEQGLDLEIAAQKTTIASWDKLIDKQRATDSQKPSASMLVTDPQLIGKKQIEEILALPKGSFGGDSIDDLTDRLLSVQKLYGYFAPGISFDKINSQLPITDQNSYYFKSILKTTDEKLSLTNDATYDFLKGNLTPDQYAEKAGRAAIRTRIVDTFGNDLGLEVGGYALNGEDMTALLNGDYLPVLLKVGAKNIDDNINLPIGTVKAMIDNPGANCTVINAATGLQQNCLENLLIANGQEKIARYLGVYGQTTTTNNISEKIGQVAIETALDQLYPNPAIPSGWFEGATLLEMAKKLASANNSADIGKYGKILLQKFGFGGKYDIYQIKTTEFIQNSEPYNLAKKVDEKLRVPIGTTARFLRGEIDSTEYKNSAQKDYLGNRAFNLILNQLPDSNIKDFIQKKNLSYSEIKGIIQNPTYKAAMGAILNRGEAGENLLGEAIIEEKLGANPIGWFNELSLPNIPNTGGLPAVIQNIVFLNNAGSVQFNAIQDPNKLLEGEIILLNKFGFSSNYSLEALQRAMFDPNDATPTNPYIITRKTDALLKIKEGSTQELFQGRLSVEDYKEKVRKAYVNYEIGEIAYGALLPDDLQKKLAKYGLDGEDLKNAFNDPGALYNKALFNIVNPADLHALLGFSEILGVKIPIKGNFPDNFAQRVVEERLGLVEGSFSPNSTIDRVMQINTPKKFAASFRINTDPSQSDSGIKTFVDSNVFKESSNYWDNSANILRSQVIDSILRLNISDPSAEPTRSLLQKNISISDYLDLVRQNQFSQFDKDTFATDLISFLTTADTEDAKKAATYLNLGNIAFSAFKSPESLKDSNIQRGLLKSLKEIGQIDLDDRIGFSPGTMENLILKPGDSRSILFAQGLRSVAEKRLFGEGEGDEKLKNDLLILFQYYLPDSISKPEYFVSVGQKDTAETDKLDPNNPNNCSGYPTPNAAPGDRNERRSLCARQIVDAGLQDIIKQATTIKDKDGNMLSGGEGISVPFSDIRLLEKGDMGVFTSIGLAYAVNRVKAEKDTIGNNINLVPKDFHITYTEIKAAMNPSSEQKKQMQDKDVEIWEKGKPFLDKLGVKTVSEEEYQRRMIEVRKEAVTNARKEIQYRYFDAQLMSMTKISGLPPIPSGFTKAMMSGKEDERNNMLMAYGVNYALINNLLPDDIAQNTVISNALTQFVQDRNMDTLKSALSAENLRNSFFDSIDKTLSEKIKIGLPPDTTANIYHYATTGKFKDTDFGQNFLQTQISGFFDKQLGLKSGTTQGMYQVYKAYRTVDAAKNTLAAAQAAYDIARPLGPVTEKISTDLTNATKGASQAKGELVSLAVSVALYAFSDELADADAKLSLPAGSTASIISFGTSWAVASAYGSSAAAAGGVYIAAAMMIYTVFFGFSKVEYQITCPGDYTFRSWCAESQALYTQWAQISTRKLIDYMLIANQQPGQEDLLPTIIGTYRKEDYNYFNGIDPEGTGGDITSKYYGGFSMQRGVKGLYQSSYMAEFVHIGY